MYARVAGLLMALSVAISASSAWADPPNRGLNSPTAVRVRVAANAQDREDQLTAAELAVVTAAREQTRVEEQIKTASINLKEVLAAVERVAIQPPDSALIGPQSIDDSVRAAIALRAMVPPMQAKLAAFRRLLVDLAELHQQNLVRRDQAKVAQRELEVARLALAALPPPETDPAAQSLAVRRADRAAARAESPSELLSGLKNSGNEATGGYTAPLAVASGSSQITGAALMPARGKVVRLFGVASGDPLTSRGLSIATRSKAEVVAAAEGRVVFAGPFRGYGQLLILEHPGGYHSLLSGLGNITTAVGRDVLAGEPVAVMGDDTAPLLYIELRRDGQPVDPMPWLAARSKG